MSFMRGTINSKGGSVQRFRDISLKELDFTSVEADLGGIDEDDDFISNKRTSECSSEMPGSRTTTRTVVSVIQRVRDMTLDDVDITCGQPVKLGHDDVDFDGLQGTSINPASAKRILTNDIPSDGMGLGDWSRRATTASDCIEVDDTVEGILKRLENVYMEDRELVVQGNGFISTPLHALKELASKYGEPLHNDVAYVKMDGVNQPLVHVELFAGLFKGVGEAFNKRMASQMAALDCLIRLESINKEDIIPYAFLPGWRINGRICQHLLSICKKNVLKSPRYVTKSNMDHPEKPVVKVECYIGKSLIGVGESDLAYVARNLSAYQAIEELTGYKYPFEFVALGTACIPNNELAQTGPQPILNTGVRESPTLVDCQPSYELEREVYQAGVGDTKRKKMNIKISTHTCVNGVDKREVSLE